VSGPGTQEPDLEWKSLPENVGFVLKGRLGCDMVYGRNILPQVISDK
jgi:hypothetical protein